MYQPASYFFWRNQRVAYDLRENLHELQLIRYYQELARLKNDFVANLYYSMDSYGFLAFLVSSSVWVFLHFN